MMNIDTFWHIIFINTTCAYIINTHKPDDFLFYLLLLFTISFTIICVIFVLGNVQIKKSINPDRIINKFNKSLNKYNT